MSLCWTLNREGEWMEVCLDGEITEDADLPSLLAELDAPRIRFDLANVSMINSSGVRDWVRFVQRLETKQHDVEFVRTAPTMVRQLNLVASFCGSFRVRSVLLPYFCDSCGAETHLSLAVSPDAQIMVSETMPCDQCNGEAEFDDIVDRYLAFATRG